MFLQKSDNGIKSVEVEMSVALKDSYMLNQGIRKKNIFLWPTAQELQMNVK